MKPLVLQARPSTASQPSIYPVSIFAVRPPAAIFSMRFGKASGQSD